MIKFNPYSSRREQTMYLSTLGTSQHKAGTEEFQKYTGIFRQSSFQKHDIEGSSPRKLIPDKINKKDYSLSTEVEPIPNRAKTLDKKSNPLFLGDIQGAKPKNKNLKTKRIVNPLSPEYILPSFKTVQSEKGRKFIRDSLRTDDINHKKICKTQSAERMKLPIQGSSPAKLARDVRATSRLDVKDIVKIDKFDSKRVGDPLKPQYWWRDNSQKNLNLFYGLIEGNISTKKYQPDTKRKDLCLDVRDIDGAQSTPFFSKFHHIDKRNEFKTFMKMKDLKSSSAPTHRKEMKTSRCTNPLTPNYQLPGKTE